MPVHPQQPAFGVSFYYSHAGAVIGESEPLLLLAH
jgi:hypothetical protein